MRSGMREVQEMVLDNKKKLQLNSDQSENISFTLLYFIFSVVVLEEMKMRKKIKKIDKNKNLKKKSNPPLEAFEY